MELKINDPVKANKYFQDKLSFTTGPVEVSHQIQEKGDIAIIDVRAMEDYKKEHIPGAVNIPKEKWDTLEGLKKESLNVLYCYSQVCHLAAQAAVHFSDKGYAVMEMEGGFKAWKEHNLPIEGDAQSSQAKTQSSPRWKTESKR
jgi:rhodanese-related sulfurtransferase